MSPKQDAPRPEIISTPMSSHVWDAANEGSLAIQSCGFCGHRQLYPRGHCVACWSTDLAWSAASGAGTVRTFTVVHMPGHPAWRSQVPYVVALVTLDEGPCLTTNIVGCSPDQVFVGQRVSLSLTRPKGTEQTLLTFAPSSVSP